MTHPFHGKSIAITGTLHMKRKDIVQYIVDHGGTFEPDINEPVDVFIFGKQKSGKPSKKETIIKNKIASGHEILLLSDDKLQQLITFYQ
ncbi:BRCT domain-containing protein [Macrococcus lamae]|uniref:BRCT domain-containing protein n=1 Tax=Macrococcus lamae TaxID=198484 RepID=UPI0024434788|nr:BRCT domain-containing protein [Macrococcus lamae]